MSDARISVLVVGARGRMGRVTVEAVRGEPDLRLAGEVDVGDDLLDALERQRPDVAVDFTEPAVVARHLGAYLERGVCPVIGTTGLEESERDGFVLRSRELGRGGLIAPNFALGAVLMMEFARRAEPFFAGLEIIEYHHPGKKDAPSGTALRTREGLGTRGADSPIHSVRLPGYLAHQEVILGGPGERLTIRHDTLDRSCFVPGILLAVRRAPELKEIHVGLETLL